MTSTLENNAAKNAAKTSATTSAAGAGGFVRRMPDDLANQIAAGEVVERPASAVKELVENAIDAGASAIRVELEEAGLRLIRVTDDGRGMSAGDAELCVQRHATSKLTAREQLFHISTLGFRGEALPSIASVSRFSLLTKPHGQLGGTRVAIEGGSAPEVSPAGAPPGTEVVVRDLFFNTPARLKFLKTRSTELKHVLEAVQRLAMPNPQVGFTVVHNGRTVLDLPPVDDAFDRVYELFGRRDAEQIWPAIPAEQDGVTVNGYFGQPGLTRRTTSGLWTFVNGRYVRDRTIIGAIRVAYQGMLDRGRHPVVVLFVDVPPSSVDVNVHPMKIEVRFHDGNAVFRAVRRAIANGLAGSPWLPDAPRPDGAPGEGGAARVEDDASQGALPVRSYTLHRPSATDADAPRSVVVGPTRRDVDRPGGVPLPAEDSTDPRPRGARDPDAPPQRGFFSNLHYIGHYKATYLLCSDVEGLVIVDQHAAHERITFETLKAAWRDRRDIAQPMLLPKVLHLDSLRAAILADHLEVFARLGFEIEPFGGTDYALKAVPALLARANVDTLIRDTLDEIGDAGRSQRIDDAIDVVLIRMACHGSVRAGHVLTADEAYALLVQIDAIDFGAHCPHGRPVWFRMELDELEKRFERR